MASAESNDHGLKRPHSDISPSLPDLDEILDKPFYRYAMDLWRRSLNAFESGDYSLVDMEIDWLIKRKFMNSYKEKHNLNDDDSRMVLVDISYHNIRKQFFGSSLANKQLGQCQSKCIVCGYQH